MDLEPVRDDMDATVWGELDPGAFLASLQSYGLQASIREAVGTFASQLTGLSSFQIIRFRAGDHADAVCGIEVEGKLTHIVKVWSDLRSGISEAVALDRLRDLSLQKLAFPELWGLGRVQLAQQELLLVGMSAAPGKPILEILYEGDFALA